MLGRVKTDRLASARSANAFGPEGDASFDTAWANGGDNSWAGYPYGPDWEAGHNTPQADVGYNSWAPGYDGRTWG